MFGDGLKVFALPLLHGGDFRLPSVRVKCFLEALRCSYTSPRYLVAADFPCRGGDGGWQLLGRGVGAIAGVRVMAAPEPTSPRHLQTAKENTQEACRLADRQSLALVATLEANATTSRYIEPSSPEQPLHTPVWAV
jgi:hypothetical protein